MPCRTALLAAIVVACVPAVVSQAPAGERVAATAAAGTPQATVAFRVRDAETGEAVPARITFRRENQSDDLLFPAA